MLAIGAQNRVTLKGSSLLKHGSTDEKQGDFLFTTITYAQKFFF